MPRPRNIRKIHEPPRYNNFKPGGIPRKLLSTVELTVDEYEAVRLTDYRKLDHSEAASSMEISRPTFTRLIESARQKVATALVEGKELIISGGSFDFEQNLHKCSDCGEIIADPQNKKSLDCPDCGSVNTFNLAENYLKTGNQRRRRGNQYDPS